MRGLITRDQSDILVNTVNCVGVMGAGTAKEFASAFPEILAPYRADCRNGRLQPGSCLLYHLPAHAVTQAQTRQRYWAALATKSHWRHPSQYDWVDSALVQLAHNARSVGARSIALTPPGCRNGGIALDRVQARIERYQGKAIRANKFIGRGSALSSTEAYRIAAGAHANTRTYAASDVVFVSAEGDRRNRMAPDFIELGKAVSAGATFITDGPYDRNRSYNIGEREVADFLIGHGYVETAPGLWVPVTN